MSSDRKYPNIRAAKDIPRNNAAVRAQLRKVIAVQRERRQFHIDSWNSHETGHLYPCAVCLRIDEEIVGLRRAIRHFGGYYK